ncbi:hypothetical protein INR49_031302 [Caranx melampygus]|nr:hypothetical protein INR49_031302 [Caranx melampygus]
MEGQFLIRLRDFRSVDRTNQSTLPSFVDKEWVQGVVAGHGAALAGAVLGLTRQLGVPGQTGERFGHGSAGGGDAVRLTLHQYDGVQGGDGSSGRIRKVWRRRGKKERVREEEEEEEEEESYSRQ